MAKQKINIGNYISLSEIDRIVQEYKIDRSKSSIVVEQYCDSDSFGNDFSGIEVWLEYDSLQFSGTQRLPSGLLGQ